jgi:hypothetical protein
MVEKISALRPGDRIELSFRRNGTENRVDAVLQGGPGNQEQVPE